MVIVNYHHYWSVTISSTQGTTHFQHPSSRFSDRPSYQKELDPSQQTCCHCVLLLWCHKKRVSYHQCGWQQGESHFIRIRKDESIKKHLLIIPYLFRPSSTVPLLQIWPLPKPLRSLGNGLTVEPTQYMVWVSPLNRTCPRYIKTYLPK